MLPRIERILYCTQLGPNAAYVLRYALALATKLSARVVTLHVLETLTTDQQSLVEGYAGSGTLHSAVEREGQRAEERLRRFVATFCAEETGSLDGGGVIERLIVVQGNATEQILRHIGTERADLVVMGAHAESSLLEALLGNTADRVLRNAPVPVLLVQVPAGRQALTMTGS